MVLKDDPTSIYCFVAILKMSRWFQKENNFVENPPKIHVMTGLFCELRIQVEDTPVCSKWMMSS